jgi:hypothetical protein
VPSIDIASPDASNTLLAFLYKNSIFHLDIVIITAGYFATESLEEPSSHSYLRRSTALTWYSDISTAEPVP